MNLEGLIRKGCRPWRPSPDVLRVDVWHEYDVPTAGVLQLPQGRVSFTAIGATDDRLSMWAYTCMTENEHRDFSGVWVSSVQALRDVVDITFAGRRAVLALADDLAIDQWSPVAVESGLLETAAGFLTQVLKALESNRHPQDRLQARLAEVEAAAQELIDA
jgi:hypothetical protein